MTSRGIRSLTVLAVLAILFVSATPLPAADTLFREDFASLDRWKPLYFPKIKKHTSYTIETSAGETYLRAESDASASGLVYQGTYNVFDYPKARWRWKVNNVYAKADPATKEGDDYPIRVYIIFAYDPDKAGFLDKVKYELGKSIYGEYPPDSTLNYVWSSRDGGNRVITSPYTDRAKLIMIERGAKRAGQWVTEEVDVLDDYRKAFGEDPPAKASIAIMSDSDNTREKAVSFVDFIEVYR